MAHPNNTLLLKLRVIIARKNQTQLAKEIGLSQSHIFQLESGSQDNPSLDTIVKYLDKFNISIFEFVDPITAKRLLISFTKNLVEDNVITMDVAAKICKHLSIKL